MSSDSESNSFTNLSSSSDKDIIISFFRPYWFVYVITILISRVTGIGINYFLWKKR